MINPRFSMIASLLFALACLSSSHGALAQPPGRPHQGGHHSHMMAEHLNLNDSQRELLRQVEEAGRASQTEIRTLRQQLRDLTHSDSYSDSQAELLISQINELMASQMIARANAENMFYQSLTEEQQSLLAQRKSHRRQNGPNF